MSSGKSARDTSIRPQAVLSGAVVLALQRVRRMGFKKGVHDLEHGKFIRAWMRSTALTMLPRLLRRKR